MVIIQDVEEKHRYFIDYKEDNYSNKNYHEKKNGNSGNSTITATHTSDKMNNRYNVYNYDTDSKENTLKIIPDFHNTQKKLNQNVDDRDEVVHFDVVSNKSGSNSINKYNNNNNSIDKYSNNNNSITKYNNKRISKPCRKRSSFWNTCCNCKFSYLPDDVMVVHVLSFLKTSELLTTSSLVCKRWNSLSQNRYLWKHLSLADFKFKLNDSILQKKFIEFKECEHEDEKKYNVSCTRKMYKSKKIGKFTKTLKLCSCSQLTKKGLVNTIHQIENVTTLHLCNLNIVNDEVIIKVANSCKNLREISLFNCSNIRNPGLLVLANRLQKLESITLRGCTEINNLLNFNPQTFKKLNIGGCTGITKSKLVEIIRKYPNLELLNLHSLEVDDEVIREIAWNCPNIHTLIASSSNPFGSSGMLTNESIKSLLRLKKLRKLDLNGASKITDLHIGELLTNCRDLEHLNLSGCSVGDVSIKSIALKAKKLTHVSVAYSSKITDASVFYLSKLQKIQYLDLHSCNKLTDLSVKILNDRFHTLKYVDLSYNCLLTVASVQKLRKDRGKCKIVFY